MRRIMVSLALLLLSACQPPAISTDPEISISWPQAEAEVHSCAMVVVHLENFNLVDATAAPPNAEGEGHFHVEYPGNYALCYRPYCLVDLSSITEPGSVVTANLTAYLVNNDHTPVERGGERIETTVPIRLDDAPCTEGTPMGGYDDTGWSDTGSDTGSDSGA